MAERNQHLCPCGSGKRMKQCCRTPVKAGKIALEAEARRLSQSGQHAAACESLERRAALSPNNPMIWNDLGNQYAAAGQLDKAIAALKRALQADPNYPVPLYNLGVHTLARCAELHASGAATAETEELAWEAIGYLNTSLAKDPDNAACHQSLVTAYGLVNQPGNARTHMVEALRLAPPSAPLPTRLLKKVTRLFS